MVVSYYIQLQKAEINTSWELVQKKHSNDKVTAPKLKVKYMLYNLMW